MSTLKISNREKTSVNAELVISGDDFDLEKVTSMLELVPSQKWKKGDSIRNKSIIRRETTWCYETGFAQSFDIREQTSHLLTAVFKKSHELKTLKKEFGLNFLVLYTIKIYNFETPIISLESEIIKFVNDIQGTIDFDLYHC